MLPITGQGQEDPVKVETLLLKVCHKKRKDVSCPVLTVGIMYVPIEITLSPSFHHNVKLMFLLFHIRIAI